MSCEMWNDRLIGRLYGDVGPGDDAALTAHLSGCERCRTALDGFQRVRAVLHQDASDEPRVPRVVVLRDRSRIRPALMAASLLGAAALAGAGAGAGYALGRAGSPAKATTAAPTRSALDPVTEELVRREVDRRVAAAVALREGAIGSKAQRDATYPAGERPLSSSTLRTELAKFERQWNGARAADLDYVLDQIAASEVRVGAQIGKTNDALRYVALTNNPRASER